MKWGFTRRDADLNLYFKVEKDKPFILVLYVDDLFLIGDDPLIHQCKRELASEFEMKDLGLMHYFLGLEVWQKPGEIFLSQEKYIVKLLERCRMVDCKEQKLVALSTAEAEYIAASMACCETIWLRKLFNELFEHVLDTTVIFCDNQRGIRLSENPVFHDRSKHIDIRYHFIRDMVQ
eukprot:PITA_26547